jgi:hypothetical protein
LGKPRHIQLRAAKPMISGWNCLIFCAFPDFHRRTQTPSKFLIYRHWQFIGCTYPGFPFGK